MQNASRLTYSALALGIVAAFAVGQADASGFQIRENSVKNLGRANAGTAVAWGDASVVLNNPAAMVNIDKNTAQIDVSLIDLNADFTGGGTTAVGTPLTGGNGGDPGDLTAVPAMAAVFKLSGGLDMVTVGASVSAPFGLKTEYDSNWVGRYNAVTSDLKTIDFTLSAAIAFTDRFSLGVGVIYVRADVTLSNAVDFGTALCAGSGNVLNCFNPAYPFRPQANDGFAEVSGDDNDWGFVVGAQLQASDNVWLGYSYRSEINHTLDGDVDFTVPPAVAATFAFLGNNAYDDGPIWANLTTPEVSTFSARWDINDSFRLVGDVQFTGWSSIQAVEIFRPGGVQVTNEPFDWKDTWAYALGGEWDMSEAFTFRAGVGYDETPTKLATRTPRLPDNDRTTFSLGMTWNVSEALSIDAAYMYVGIATPDIDIESSSSTHLTGSFDGDANLFGVAAQYRF